MLGVIQLSATKQFPDSFIVDLFVESYRQGFLGNAITFYASVLFTMTSSASSIGSSSIALEK